MQLDIQGELDCKLSLQKQLIKIIRRSKNIQDYINYVYYTNKSG